METGFGPRHYREGVAPAGMVSFTVRVRETDLWIAAVRDLTAEAERAVGAARAELERFIAARPDFARSLAPVEVPPDAPRMVREMAAAGSACAVGPMAAVAGAVAEAVARELAPLSPELLVENGGDLYLVGERERTVAVWAGLSPFSGKMGLAVVPGRGMAVATSSATVGPSLSLGNADAATVVARSGALADAAASFLGNRLREPADLEPALAATVSLPGVRGALGLIGGKMGVQGKIEIVPL